jgi:heptosyltransferase-2
MPPGPIQSGAQPSTHHQIHEYLNLAAALGADATPIAPSIHVTDEELRRTAEKFQLSPSEGEQSPIFGLNPGAEYGPAKRWPAEQFISAAAQIQRHARCRWVIFGSQADFQLAETIARQISSLLPQGNPPLQQERVLNLAGKTTLEELCMLLKLCSVLLTNDTGPMHLAAAVGTTVVVPFGSTSSELTGPGLPGDSQHQLLRSDAPCSPCFRRECPIDFRCMHGITVERVVQAVLRAKHR